MSFSTKVKKLKFKAIFMGWGIDVVGSYIIGTLLGIFLMFVHKINNLPREEQTAALVALPELFPLAALLGYVFSIIGGFIVAKLSNRDVYLNAFAASILGIIFSLVTSLNHLPLWFSIANIVLTPLCYLLGANIYERM